MKKQTFILLALACFSLTSGLCSHPPPLEAKQKHESTFAQTVTDHSPMFTITARDESFALYVAEIPNHFVTMTKENEDFTSCASCTPTKDVQFVDTSTSVSHSVTYTLDKRSIPELNFNYIEGRATEYRS